MEFLHHKGIKVELKIARAAMVVCIHTHSSAWATVCTQLQHRLLDPKKAIRETCAFREAHC